MRVAMRAAAVIVAVLLLTVFMRAMRPMRGIRRPGGPMRVFVLVRVVSVGIILTGHLSGRRQRQRYEHSEQRIRRQSSPDPDHALKDANDNTPEVQEAQTRRSAKCCHQ